MKRFFLLLCYFAFFSVLLRSLFTPVLADVLTLKSDYPNPYIVKKGDTLWDISDYFLKNPWHWSKLWGENPQIANPHLIYPGDKLTLAFIDGKPRLVVKPHLRKQPTGRIVPKDNAIPAVDLSLIRPYLTHNRVVERKWLQNQPMVLGGESPSRHHVTDNIIYIRGILPVGEKVGIYEEGRQFKRSSELLGIEAILTSVGRVTESGDISKVKLLNSYSETKAGDRVIRIDSNVLVNAYFMPKPAELLVPAKVLTSVTSIREMGKLDIAYIDRGNLDGVKSGDVFAIYRDGVEIMLDTKGKPVLSDNYNAYNRLVSKIDNKRTTKYQLPNIYHGNIMVFKTFDKMSVGIIMANEHAVRANDNLVTPKVTQL